MKSPLTFSVVIPAHNAEKHLGAALRSICHQDMQPLEIIVVDDGSTDDTASVARSFSARVKYFRQENAGAAAARNAGIHRACGTHVAFLDADDLWLPDHLANIKMAFERFPVRWCATAYRMQFDDEPAKDVVRSLTGVDHNRPSLLKDYFIACSRTWRVWTSACAVERSLLLDNDCFDKQLRIGEDIDLWFRLALAEPSLAYCPRPSAVYRQVADSLMHQMPSPGDGWFEGLCRMKAQASAKGPGVLKQVRPLLARNANAAARVAGRTSNRKIAMRMLLQNGDLLKPTIWLRLAFSLVLPPYLNRTIWTLRHDN